MDISVDLINHPPQRLLLRSLRPLADQCCTGVKVNLVFLISISSHQRNSSTFSIPDLYAKINSLTFFFKRFDLALILVGVVLLYQMLVSNKMPTLHNNIGIVCFSSNIYFAIGTIVMFRNFQ